MNPIIAHDLMQARIADLHRPPGRISTGSRKHPCGVPKLVQSI
jgi:hypothetical protein